MKLSARLPVVVSQLEDNVWFDPGDIQHVPENLKWSSLTARPSRVEPKHLFHSVSPGRGLPGGRALPGAWWTRCLLCMVDKTFTMHGGQDIHCLALLHSWMRVAGPFYCGAVFLNCWVEFLWMLPLLYQRSQSFHLYANYKHDCELKTQMSKWHQPAVLGIYSNISRIQHDFEKKFALLQTRFFVLFEVKQISRRSPEISAEEQQDK